MRKLPLDFEAFHRMYRPIYVHWAEIRLGSRADAEEAVDAAFEKLLRAWSAVLTKETRPRTPGACSGTPPSTSPGPGTAVPLS